MVRITNWNKRLGKLEDDRLRPGERIRATLVLQVRGAVARAALIGGMSGVAHGVAQSTVTTASRGAIRAASGRPGTFYGCGGLAGRLPVKPLLLVLTDHDRVLVFSWIPVLLRLTYETELPASQIDTIEVKRGFWARKARLTFTDGSAVPFDLPWGHAHKEFRSRYWADAATRRG